MPTSKNTDEQAIEKIDGNQIAGVLPDDFDVLNFETKHIAEEGTFMPFKNPKTGEDLEHQTDKDPAPRKLGLVLKGGDSGDAQRVVRQLQARERRRGENYTPSNSDLEKDRIADSKAIAKLVTGGLIFSKGAWVDITSDNAADYLYIVDPLRKQAIKHIFDEGNFIAA